MEKSLSFVRRMRFSRWAWAATDSSEVRGRTILTSCPEDLKNRITSARKFSSARNRMTVRQLDQMTVVRHLGRVFQSGLDVLFGQLGVGVFYDFFGGFSGGEHLQNKIDHNAGPLKARFAVANSGIGGDILVDVHSVSIAEGWEMSIRVNPKFHAGAESNLVDWGRFPNPGKRRGDRDYIVAVNS